MTGFEFASLMKEASSIKEGISNGFDEIKKQLSPQELKQNAERSGLAGQKGEREAYKAEVAEKSRIMEASPYSDKINDYVRSESEVKVYQNGRLEEGVVNDRPVLKSPEIDPTFKDASGNTNLERMKMGRPPLDKYGESLELHHIGQKMDSPLAELTKSEHKLYDKTLHDKSQPSVIDRDTFAFQRSAHWKARANDFT